ncbi:MAG: hypothetical protein NTW79_00415 [Candidatus Berkelbacteria bacterium]|nr:hypothetical protein [Candidatus Berkelbacteria bacterium]
MEGITPYIHIPEFRSELSILEIKLRNSCPNTLVAVFLKGVGFYVSVDGLRVENNYDVFDQYYGLTKGLYWQRYRSNGTTLKSILSVSPEIRDSALRLSAILREYWQKNPDNNSYLLLVPSDREETRDLSIFYAGFQKEVNKVYLPKPKT